MVRLGTENSTMHSSRYNNLLATVDWRKQYKKVKDLKEHLFSQKPPNFIFLICLTKLELR